jgi:hypothetical protein
VPLTGEHGAGYLAGEYGDVSMLSAERANVIFRHLSKTLGHGVQHCRFVTD